MKGGSAGPGAVNPYAAPTAIVDDVPADPQAARVRMEHLAREASIQSLGTLYYLAAAGAALGFLVFGTTEGEGGIDWLRRAGILLGGGLVCAAFVALGRGLRLLRPWARVPACILAAIGLLGFPVGTVVNSYILWMLLTAKGRTVLSTGYAEVVRATPDIRYRSSRFVSIAFLLLVAFMLLALFLPFVLA